MRDPHRWPFHQFYFPGSTHVVYVAAKNSGPNWAEIVTAVATGVVALGILVAGVQVAESRRSRQAALATDLTRQWGEKSLVDARKKAFKLDASEIKPTYLKLKKTREEEYFLFQDMLGFFEDMGALEKTHCLHIEWIDETLGGPCLYTWARWEDTILALRQLENASRVPDGKYQPRTSRTYANFEYLARKLKRREESRMRLEDYRIQSLRIIPRLIVQATRWTRRALHLLVVAIFHQAPP